jgi:hypothetical protein
VSLSEKVNGTYKRSSIHNTPQPLASGDDFSISFVVRNLAMIVTLNQDYVYKIPIDVHQIGVVGDGLFDLIGIETLWVWGPATFTYVNLISVCQ